MTIKIENWEHVTEMINKLKKKPFKIEVYEGNDYMRVEFYFKEELVERSEMGKELNE